MKFDFLRQGKRSLVYVKLLCYVAKNKLCVLSPSKLYTVLAQIVGGRLNGEPKTMNCISNAAVLSFKLFLSEGRHISCKKWFRDLFSNEDSNISQCQDE